MELKLYMFTTLSHPLPHCKGMDFDDFRNFKKIFFFRFQEFAPPPLTFKKMLRAYFLLIKERLKLDTQQ